MDGRMTIDEAEKKIKKAIQDNGPYSNNVVGSVLRVIDKEHGKNAAIDLMEKHRIEELFSIPKPERD